MDEIRQYDYDRENENDAARDETETKNGAEQTVEIQSGHGCGRECRPRYAYKIEIGGCERDCRPRCIGEIKFGCGEPPCREKKHEEKCRCRCFFLNRCSDRYW